MNTSTVPSALDTFGVERFLQNYWQRKAVLIPQALPAFDCPVDGNDLAALALEEAVESRLVVNHRANDAWELHCGPLTESDFNQLPEQDWTLLVQAVDHWIEEVSALKRHFSFLPGWRMDDVMISFAPQGGGVGPHFDYYDVFLLQGQGRRRWRIGQQCDASTPVRHDATLSILCDFQTVDDWILEPGDILYVPPGVAHWGEALDDCLTLSIGFRAPAENEFLVALAERAMELLPAHRRYTDPINEGSWTGNIDESVLDRLQEIVRSTITDRGLLADCFAGLMTEPKYPLADSGEHRVTPEELRDRVSTGAQLLREPAARFACVDVDGGVTLYANGERIGKHALLAQKLGNSQDLDNTLVTTLLADERAIKMLCLLLNNGSLVFKL